MRGYSEVEADRMSNPEDTQNEEDESATVRVTYRPVAQDLADQSMSFGDPETLTLSYLEHVEAGEHTGEHVRGVADDGRGVVVFTGTGRVRARESDEGAFDQYLGKVEDSVEAWL